MPKSYEDTYTWESLFFKLKFHILFCICYTEKYTPVFKSFSSLYSMFGETQGVLL